MKTVECDSGEYTYEDFMVIVDGLLEKTVEMNHECFADTNTYHMWELGAEPCEVAQDILENEFGSAAPVIPEYEELHG
jgi:hypothetical protein